VIEALFFTATRVLTFAGAKPQTNASGFFFERDERLFLVTSRHVLFDEPSKHFPDRIEIELHIDPEDLARSTGFSIPLYREKKGLWRQGRDTGGEIDVAVIEIDRDALPPATSFQAFTPRHLPEAHERIEAGTPMLVIGFPLGFHDARHHMPVVRRATAASPFGLRFQGEGYFLTDARTHRGTSGAPVVMRALPDSDVAESALPWQLLGVHSARMDVGSRDMDVDEALGLNCAWYADILMTLTEP
jgi:hypothetical protein